MDVMNVPAVAVFLPMDVEQQFHKLVAQEPSGVPEYIYDYYYHFIYLIND